MPRPRLQRIVAGQPVVTVYKPAGVPARVLQWVNLTLDEFEAIRLIDNEGLDQETVAVQMGVSRPTVTRILASARGKIARFLTYGQALLIQGGPVMPPAFGAGRGRGGGFGRGGYGRGGRGFGGRGRGRGRGGFRT
ncbi:MAG: DUF134 domain-containing protein [Planctomycetota bacterium]|nr:DUF134 domain-containing protein [Planctomycetota bacterium]